MGITFALADHKRSDGFIKDGLVPMFKLSGSSNNFIKSDSIGKAASSNVNVVVQEGSRPGVEFRRQVLDKMVNIYGLGKLNLTSES